MTFKVGGYSFKGRYAVDEIDQIKDWPGLYAILCRRGSRHYLVDVGESKNVKLALRRSKKKELWRQNCSGDLVVSVYYTIEMKQAERARIKRKIRTRHNPLCSQLYLHRAR